MSDFENIPSSVMQNVISMKSTKSENHDHLIPEKDHNFEKFGFYNDLKKIIKSKVFYPIFIAGPSGGGKTFLVNQVCAELKRECIRVNFSIETDQTDLIGGPTLVNGNIIYAEGPVIQCLRNGWILLLDEIDRSNPNNILILNGILEGQGFYNPKTGEYIKAAQGFNVIMTANSKGYGDETGKYLSQILDSAFLERLPVTFEQEFPNESTEKKILAHHLDDVDFIDKLVKWARVIRKTFENGGIDEVISTRRLVHIAQAYSMFNNDKMKAITLCVARFESHTRDAFIDLYTKIDAGVDPEAEEEAEAEELIEKVYNPPF
jgi:MoxR-like ATPase